MRRPRRKPKPPFLQNPEQSFLFELALALGKTVGELTDSLTQSEFIHWIAYFKQEPRASKRLDYGFGALIFHMRRCVGDKSVTWENSVLSFKKPEVVPPEEVNRRNASVGKLLLATFGGKRVSKPKQ